MILDSIWPAVRAGDALVQLATAARLAPRPAELGVPGEDMHVWLDEAARTLGIETTPVSAQVAELADVIAGAAPALLELEHGVVAVISARRGRALVLTPDGARTRIAIAELAEALSAPALAPIRATIASQVATLELPAASRGRTAAALLAARVRRVQIAGVMMVRLAPETSMRRHAIGARLGPRFAGVAAAHVASYACGLAAWWELGRAALRGRLDSGSLAAWALLVLTAVTVRAIAMSWMGRVSIDAAALLKQRLLAGVLRFDLDALRAEGVGQRLGRVFESTAIERLAIDGGFLALFAVLELIVAAVVLGLSIGGWIEVPLLLAMLVGTALLVRRYRGRRRAWTDRRLEITHDLVEAMVGHATRLAQQPAEDRHDREDRMLVGYTTMGTGMDHTLVALRALIPRGWLVLATAGLAPLIVIGHASPGELAIALGGVLLAFAALQKLTRGAAQLVGAAIAWRAIEPLVTAAAQPEVIGTPGIAVAPPSASSPLATLRNVVYRPTRRTRAVLVDCTLVIERGDHVLLEGASGAGKSTIAGLLAGLRAPDGGLVLAGGLDLASLGASGWRRRIACAPQFHENHLFSASLAYNLLVGRAWPPRSGDLDDARAICLELGLGDLLERMPSGLEEMVGETGWQLSHGERSRVFLARALLQDAPLVVLDESLAALDPATLQTAVACIERRSGAALLIAHP